MLRTCLRVTSFGASAPGTRHAADGDMAPSRARLRAYGVAMSVTTRPGRAVVEAAELAGLRQSSVICAPRPIAMEQAFVVTSPRLR